MNSQTVFNARRNRHHPYVLLPTHFLDDPRLTWAAKGVLAYLLSRPDEETIRLSDLVNGSADEHDAVDAALSELHTFGYVVLERAQGTISCDAPSAEEERS
jgi:hypothetical protein